MKRFDEPSAAITNTVSSGKSSDHAHAAFDYLKVFFYSGYAEIMLKRLAY